MGPSEVVCYLLDVPAGVGTLPIARDWLTPGSNPVHPRPTCPSDRPHPAGLSGRAAEPGGGWRQDHRPVRRGLLLGLHGGRQGRGLFLLSGRRQPRVPVALGWVSE